MYQIEKRDTRAAGIVLGEAFFNDPLWNYYFPDDAQRRSALDQMFEFLVLCGITFGFSFASSSNLEGIAVWFPKKTADFGFFRLLFSGLLGKAINSTSEFRKEFAEIQKSMKPVAKDRKTNMGRKNYLYLSVIGVAPDHQRKGHGGQILNYLKQEAKHQELPVYLETVTEQNTEMYRHLGFRTFQVRPFKEPELHVSEMVLDP